MVKSMSSYPQAAPTNGMQCPYDQPEADMRCQHSSSYLSHTYIKRDKPAKRRQLEASPRERSVVVAIHNVFVAASTCCRPHQLYGLDSERLDLLSELQV